MSVIDLLKVDVALVNSAIELLHDESVDLFDYEEALKDVGRAIVERIDCGEYVLPSKVSNEEG